MIITPKKSLLTNLTQLIQSRELLYYLAIRDIRLRYKYKTIGIFWGGVQPLLYALVLSFTAGKLQFFKTYEISYLPFALIGVAFWNYFTSSLGRAGTSLLNNQSLIRNVYFPRLIIPISSMSVGIIDFLLSIAIFIIISIIYGIHLSPLFFILLIPCFLLTIVFSLGLGMLFSFLNVRYRDMREIIPFFITLLFFLTPIMYPIRIIPENFHMLLYLNPLTTVVELMRSTVFPALSIPLLGIVTSIISAIVFLLIGFFYFQHNEKQLADVL